MLPAIFVLFLALWRVMGFDLGLSTKCVAIPKEMVMCRDIGYSEMRLPNLMGHTSMAEVLLKSAGWQHLIRTGCHPHTRTFLCSLFAPVCLDTFIHPCRSMCAAVRDSCAPVLGCQGHSWPSTLRCDRFPRDDDTCLASLGKEYKPFLRVFPKSICQNCPAVDEFPTRKRVLDTFSANHFAVKVKLSRKLSIFNVQEPNIDCQVEFVKQGLLSPYEAHNAIEQWFLVNENCTQQMIHSHHPMVYLIMGTTEQSHVLVNQVFRWQRWDSLETRKWRHHKSV
ncbi:secreted frizzled-related protein 2-like [Elgaria multicarinata webbii]|uniref:secreted frizzled-related protein 2-like n=1 Tax=Elgaria multicarinata webbii TaxID=159646 RepID=UPI002FCD2CA7